MNGPSTWGKRAAVIAGAAGVVAAGAAVGLAAERYANGKSFRGDDLEVDEPLGQIHGRIVPVHTTDGVLLHVEVDDGDGDSDVTVVFCHGLALDMGTWHYQRRDLGDLGRLVFWDQRGQRAAVSPARSSWPAGRMWSRASGRGTSPVPT